ncbi:MAG: serine hydrolase [Candidatus Heimdallarchaeota archaeon]|nr:serine hydrolase [Candidatus Heimdallarchaeota archaeon]
MTTKKKFLGISGNSLIIITFSLLIFNTFPLFLGTSSLIDDGTPIDEIFDTEFDNQIDIFMNDPTAPVPSFALSVVYKNEPVFTRTYGNWDQDSLIHIQSITKTFTATLIMQLYEENMLDLHDDINDYRTGILRNPSFPDTPITIHHCLSHQSSYGESNWLNYEPGSDTCYTNYNFFFLKDVIENITGSSYTEYLDEKILTPLGITNYNDLFNSGAFGLEISAVDMMKWLTVHLNNGTYQNKTIINEDSIQLMHDNHALAGEFKYGYGWITVPPGALVTSVNVTLQGHPGGHGPNSQFILIEEYELGCFFSADRDYTVYDSWWLLNEYVLNKVLQIYEEEVPINSSTTTVTTTTITTDVLDTTTSETTNVSFFITLLSILVIFSRKRK